jgi:hypothetical protein
MMGLAATQDSIFPLRPEEPERSALRDDCSAPFCKRRGPNQGTSRFERDAPKGLGTFS